MWARIVAGLVLAAEAGHLVAAVEEAEAWPLLSGCHVLFAVAYGWIFSGLPSRRASRLAVALATTLAAIWLFTRTVGLPTYLTLTRLPVTPTGIATTLTEVALLLLGTRAWRPETTPKALSAAEYEQQGP